MWYFVQVFVRPKSIQGISYTIGNKTKETIQFSVGKDKFQMPPGQTSGVKSTSPYPEIIITWPPDKNKKVKTDKHKLEDKAEYHFTEMNGVYKFEKVGATKAEGSEGQIFELLNAYRVKQGASKLARDKKLDAVASAHAEAMAKVDKQAYVLNNKGTKERLADAGCSYPSYVEILGTGGVETEQSLAAGAMKRWIESPSHEKILRAANYSIVGLGAAKSAKSGTWYFSLLFAHPKATEEISYTIENKTKETIQFSLGASKFQLAPGRKGKLIPPVQNEELVITWPPDKNKKVKTEKYKLVNNGEYTISETDGVYKFEKREPKDSKDKDAKDKDS
jgi:uncharacterized protein YkwD